MTHLKPGDRVMIWNQTPAGELFEEGEAKLVERAGPMGMWTVMFDGDSGQYLRHADPNDRADQ